MRPEDHPPCQSCLGARPNPSTSLGRPRTLVQTQRAQAQGQTAKIHISSTKPSPSSNQNDLPNTIAVSSSHPEASSWHCLEDRRSLVMQDLLCQMTIEDPELTRSTSRDPGLRAQPSPASPAPSFRCF